MLIHYQTDYTFYFEEDEITALELGQIIHGKIMHLESRPLTTVCLKERKDMYPLLKKLSDQSKKARQDGRSQDCLVYQNEADLAIVHWEKENHHLYFQKEWFMSITELLLAGKVTDPFIRWGAEKITILAGTGTETERFKRIWGSS